MTYWIWCIFDYPDGKRMFIAKAGWIELHNPIIADQLIPSWWLAL